MCLLRTAFGTNNSGNGRRRVFNPAVRLVQSSWQYLFELIVYDGRRLYGLGLLEAKRPRKWSLFFHIDLAPAILRFSRISLQAVSGWIFPQVVSMYARILLRAIGEWSRHRDTTSPKERMVLTISMISVPLATLTSFFQAFGRVIMLEVKNLLIPEDRKMKQNDIIDYGVTIFMSAMYGWGISVLVCLPLGFLVVVVQFVKYRLRVYRWRRRSRLLPSSIWDVA